MTSIFRKARAWTGVTWFSWNYRVGRVNMII